MAMLIPTSILVLGAGELGSEVIKSLARHPARSDIRLALLLRPSTISTADARKRAELECYRKMNVDIIAGDVVKNSSHQLARLFAPFHTVISCTGMTFPKGTQIKITKAVIAAGVHRYFAWQFGIDYDKIGRDGALDLFNEQLDLRDLLRSQQGMRWVIVSTGMFISFLFEPDFGVVDLDEGSVTAIGSLENALIVTAPSDIGKITADIALAASEEHGVVLVAGDTVSMGRLADLVAQHIGLKVKRSVKSVQQLAEELDAVSDDVMRKYRKVFGAGVSISWDKASSYNRRNGIDTMTVQSWMQENL